MPVSVAPNDPHSTHHMALVAEDGTRVGLILCDSTGKRLPYSVARSNLQSVPLKTASGASQYSDLELPFVVSAQQDWSGGLGQDRFEDNKTRYARGLRIQSVRDGITLGPMEHYNDVDVDTGQTAPGPNRSVGYWPTERSDTVQVMDFYRANSPAYIAIQFEPLEDTVNDYLWLMFRESELGDTAGSTVHWEIQSDSADEPSGTVLDFGDFTNGVDFDHPAIQLRGQRNSTPITLTGGTKYWLVLFSQASADADNHGFMYYQSIGLSFDGLGATSDDNGTWTTGVSFRPIFRITEGEPDEDLFGGFFFEYREQLYFVTRPDGEPDTPSRLFMNGWRGAADSNTGALGKLKDSTQTGWADNAAAGSVVKIIAGKGSEEDVAYRYVQSSVSGELNVTPDWVIEHDTTTSYVVLGAHNHWEEISPTAGDAFGNTVYHRPVSAGSTDTAHAGMIAYFSQHRDSAGAGDRIRAMREYNNAGVWTREWTTYHISGGGEHGEFLTLVEDETDGYVLYKAEQGYITGVGALAQRALLSHEWGDTDWTAFGADELIGHDKDEKIVNLLEHLDPDTEVRIPWIITEGRLTARRDGVWRSVKLDELRAFASKFTGKVALSWNQFLYLSLGGGLLEQFSNGVLIDAGPGRELNPFEWTSSVAFELEAGATYPGRLFVAANELAGDTGDMASSLVFQTTGNNAWDCIYQGPHASLASGTYNPRIRDLFVQSVPSADGRKVNRLWMLQGKDLVWLELPQQGSGPLTDPAYSMAIEGAIESSKIYADVDDRNKVFSSLKLITDDVDGTQDADNYALGQSVIRADYEVDNEGDVVSGNLWEPVDQNFFDTSPSQERFITDYFTDDTVDSVRGKYLKYRLRMRRTFGQGGDRPRVRAVLVESLVGLPVKYSFSQLVLFEDRQLDLRNHADDYATALAKIDALEGYADTPEVFTLESIAPALDGAKVVIASPEIQPVEMAEAAAASEDGITQEAYIGDLKMIQLVLE